MKINYLGLGSDLKEILYNKFDKNDDVIYIFENPATYYEIKREYSKGATNLFYNFKLFTLGDFYEKLFKTDRIVIREEKQVVLFYNSLTDKIKKSLKIESYYDIIDLAYNYYNLFAELQEYNVDRKNIRIEEWQREVFEILLEIDDSIKEKLQEKGLILPYMLRKIENLDETFLKRCKKICFVNKVNFTPFEVELLKVMENRGLCIENFVQLDNKDFDEEKLAIKSTFGLPEKDFFEKKGINIEICQFDNKFTQLMGVIKKLEKEEEKLRTEKEVENGEKRKKREVQYRIYDAQDINDSSKGDYQLLNQNRITYNLEETMQNSKIYKILDLLCNILENVKVKWEKNGERCILFRIKELYDGFKFEEFLKVFNLKDTYKYFQTLAMEGYRYISLEMLKKYNQAVENTGYSDKIFNFIRFLEELEKVYDIDNLKNYGEYLENLFERQEEPDDKIRDKYFEALSEMVILEDFSFDKLWQGFFNGSVSASLLKMFLKYLDKKATSLDIEEIDEQQEESRYKINMFSGISETTKENIIFLNLQDTFPKVKVNNYLFSKKQRIEMGLPVNEDMKQLEFFKFFNNVFSGKNICFSYVKNLDENIDCAGIIEEIKLKYGISVVGGNEGGEIKEEEELSFIKKYFTIQGEKWEKKEIGKFIPSRLEKDIEKLKKEKLSLGYYRFEKMRNFEYGYYLEEKIGKVEVEEIKEEIDHLLFGNIIHATYEKIVKENKEKIEKNEYKADIEEIKRSLSEILSAFEYKMPTEFIRFYREVSFDEIAKSIKKFFSGIRSGEITELMNAEDFEIYSEERVKQKQEREIKNISYPNVFINGIMDLYIRAGQQEILIDYKSGNLEKKKFVKAMEQLDFYSILLGEEKEKNRGKYVVDTWNGQILGDVKERASLSREELEEVIRNYFERKFYGLGEKKNTWNHEIYKDIVRWKEEDSDDRI